MTVPAPLDQFRHALAGATRAIARDAEADVVFASEGGAAESGKTARVASPGPALEPRLVAEARGAADALALRLRHHDAEAARSARAARADDDDARAVFDALETARVEALGARAMDGVRANLRELAEARVRTDAITRARTAEEVPLATAVGLIARAAADRRGAARGGARRAGDWSRRGSRSKAGAELDALALTIDDQAAFATLSRRLLEDLDLADADDRAEQQPEEGGDDDQGEEDGPDEDDDAETEGGAAGRRDGNALARRAERDEGEDRRPTSERDVDEGEATSRRRGRRAGARQPVAAQLARRAGHRLSRHSPPASTKSSRPASCATRRN